MPQEEVRRTLLRVKGDWSHLADTSGEPLKPPLRRRCRPIISSVCYITHMVNEAHDQPVSIKVPGLSDHIPPLKADP